MVHLSTSVPAESSHLMTVYGLSFSPRTDMTHPLPVALLHLLNNILVSCSPVHLVFCLYDASSVFQEFDVDIVL